MHISTLQNFRSPTHTIKTNTHVHVAYNVTLLPSFFSLSHGELRKELVNPGMIYMNMDLLHHSTEAWEQLLLNKNLPWAVTHHPASATPNGQSNLSASCIRNTDATVISLNEKSVLHISLYFNTTHFIVWHSDTDCVTDIVKTMKPFHLITWFMKPIAVLESRESVVWRAQSHMSWRQNQFDSVKSEPRVMRLIWCNRFKVPVQRWWMLRLWQRRRRLN